MRFPSYHPPVFNARVQIRNPSNRPDSELDRFGRVIHTDPAPASYEFHVYANVRDSRPSSTLGEEGVLNILNTVFTIRSQQHDLDADCEVRYMNKTYRSIGKPVERGGVNGGMSAKFFEIHAQLVE